uniref:Uncharacterized protein n=1 Tax=Macrostomum lignano TaxID=282301 RepID=A0A1I8FKP9_9PLAT
MSGAGRRAFACLAAYVWRRKRRAGRVLLPPPQPAGSAVFTDQSSSIVVHF